MKNVKFFLMLIAVVGAAFSLQQCKDKDKSEQIGNEVIFHNGAIYTVNEAQPWVEAIYVKDGIIVVTGSLKEVEEVAPRGAEYIDLEGGFMMPGIHDVHLHALEASSENFQFTLDQNEEDMSVLASEVLKAHHTNSGNDWLLGWGHSLATLLEASESPISYLDNISTARPIAIMEVTSHSIWCNSKALEMVGYTKNSPDPVGGILMKDDAGNLNGILVDNAGNLLIDKALETNANREQKDYLGIKEFALPTLGESGITSICDARAYWKRNHHKTWQKLANQNELTVRVNLGLWAYPDMDDDSQLAQLKSMFDVSNELLKVNQIKVYADGIIHSTTAAMHDDYKVDYFERPTNNGLNYFTQERLAKYITALEAVGFDFHIHAIGNRGVHEALNAIESNGSSKGRHRLTHVEFVDQADLPRFKALNVTADAQVAGEFTQPAFWQENEAWVGSDLTQNIIPIKSLFEAGGNVTLSSDWDVSELYPFVAIEHAVTRIPQEITLAQAIRAYTINAAYVMRQEDKVGSIEEGKEADLVILDKNPFEIDPSQISEIAVLETYLKGKIVYTAE